MKYNFLDLGVPVNTAAGTDEYPVRRLLAEPQRVCGLALPPIQKVTMLRTLAGIKAVPAALDQEERFDLRHGRFGQYYSTVRPDGTELSEKESALKPARKIVPGLETTTNAMIYGDRVPDDVAPICWRCLARHIPTHSWHAPQGGRTYKQGPLSGRIVCFDPGENLADFFRLNAVPSGSTSHCLWFGIRGHRTGEVPRPVEAWSWLHRMVWPNWIETNLACEICLRPCGLGAFTTHFCQGLTWKHEWPSDPWMLRHSRVRQEVFTEATAQRLTFREIALTFFDTKKKEVEKPDRGAFWARYFRPGQPLRLDMVAVPYDQSAYMGEYLRSVVLECDQTAHPFPDKPQAGFTTPRYAGLVQTSEATIASVTEDQWDVLNRCGGRAEACPRAAFVMADIARKTEFYSRPRQAFICLLMAVAQNRSRGNGVIEPPPIPWVAAQRANALRLNGRGLDRERCLVGFLSSIGV